MSNESPIKIAVLPVAGLGTRFLPVTKSSPKELLSIVDKPIIQYVVDEAIEAGIDHIIFVTSSTKRAVEDYFDTNFELEARLEQAGKKEALEIVRNIIPESVRITYVRQSEPAGLGHAVLCARHVVGDRPFAVLLPDDIIYHKPGVNTLKNMIQIYEATKMSVIGVQKVPPAETNKYGIVALENENQHLEREGCAISSIVEKPALGTAPSNFAVAGRYILIPSIFDCLEDLSLGVGNEIQLTDAIHSLIQSATVYAYLLQGERYDCGSKIGFIKATLVYALGRKELAAELSVFLEELLNEYDYQM